MTNKKIIKNLEEILEYVEWGHPNWCDTLNELINRLNAEEPDEPDQEGKDND